MDEPLPKDDNEGCAWCHKPLPTYPFTWMGDKFCSDRCRRRYGEPIPRFRMNTWKPQKKR